MSGRPATAKPRVLLTGSGRHCSIEDSAASRYKSAVARGAIGVMKVIRGCPTRSPFDFNESRTVTLIPANARSMGGGRQHRCKVVKISRSVSSSRASAAPVMRPQMAIKRTFNPVQHRNSNSHVAHNNSVAGESFTVEPGVARAVPQSTSVV